MMSSCFLTDRRSSQCILVYDVKKGQFQIRSNMCKMSAYQKMSILQLIKHY